MNEYHPQTVTHPGYILQEALEDYNIGSKEFAVKTGKPEKTISAVLKEKSSITPEMAILFEKVLQIPASFWLEAQKNYDEYLARIRYKSTINDAMEWARSFPYSSMVKFGWVAATRKVEEKVLNLFSFFGVSSLQSFEDFYFNQKTQVSFRISLKNQKHALSIAAWLKQGELQSRELPNNPYSEKRLRDSLHSLKNLMAKQPTGFFAELQQICLEAGVKVVHTPCLPNTSIHGSTRWLGQVPLIQLSGRYNRNDIFWFTFFHEIGHILLHGKKYISIENIDIEGEIAAFEKEADAFASDIILKDEDLDAILISITTPKDLIPLAKKYNTHPACIVGRLHHKKLLHYSFGKEYFEKVEF